MEQINNIKKASYRLIRSIRKKIENNINALRGKIYREQVQAENKSKGLSGDDIKSELQYALYSNRFGKLIISFCEYILYALVFFEIVIFLGRESLDYRMVELFFELGIIELFLGVVIGSVCYIKNKRFSLFIYALTVACTYFLRLTDEHTYYNVLNIVVSLSSVLLDILIIRKFIKSNGTSNAFDKFNNIFKSNDTYEDTGHTEIMIRCPKCANICNKDDNFCVNCGETIKFQRRAERNSKKSINDKITSNIKKSSKNIENNDELCKTSFIDRTSIMDNIEEKIIKHTDDEYEYN